LYLDHNQLSGEIPKELGLMTSSEVLGLSSNQLEGEVPPQLGLLTKLRWLSIAENKLTGSIPKGFVHLKKLERLSLSRNQLEGGEGLCLYSNHVGGTWAVLVFPFSRSYSQLDSLPTCSVKEHFLQS
jgi:hypothetical protein